MRIFWHLTGEEVTRNKDFMQEKLNGQKTWQNVDRKVWPIYYPLPRAMLQFFTLDIKFNIYILIWHLNRFDRSILTHSNSRSKRVGVGAVTKMEQKGDPNFQWFLKFQKLVISRAGNLFMPTVHILVAWEVGMSLVASICLSTPPPPLGGPLKTGHF